MLTELTKKVSRQQLFMCGYFTKQEIQQLRKDGWRVLWQDKKERIPRTKRKIQQNKNGIPVFTKGAS
ncbi:hypothetical protein NCCP2222_19430 [Sporosarcina sp. NCCP-2222]|nr:hypothetical protein NCCP2222_19430 [Sporosarcina sp. NCCP-2222]